MRGSKVRNEERPKRASRARNRPLAHFRPDFWRRSKVKGARPHIKGKFHGGAVVLETSTEIDEEYGSPKPRKVIWIIHAGNMIKCTPDHLRYSSERARQLANLGPAQRLTALDSRRFGWMAKTFPDVPCVSQILGGLGVMKECLNIPSGIGCGGNDTGRLVT